jgi:hypothetical protein
MGEETTENFGIPLEPFDTGIADAETYNKAMRLIDELLGSAAGAYAGSFSQASPPSITQIPDGKWGFWWNTTPTVDAGYILLNRGGTFYYAPLYASGEVTSFGVITLLTSSQTTTSATFVFLARQFINVDRFNAKALAKELILRVLCYVSAAGIEGEIRLYDVTNATVIGLVTCTETVPTGHFFDGYPNLPASGVIEVELQFRRSVGAGAASVTVDFAHIDHALKIP